MAQPTAVPATRHALALIELALELASPEATDFTEVPADKLVATFTTDLRGYAERVYEHATAILCAGTIRLDDEEVAR